MVEKHFSGRPRPQPIKRTAATTLLVSVLLLAPSLPAAAQTSTWGRTTTVSALAAIYLRGESEVLKTPGRIALDGSDHRYLTDPDSEGWWLATRRIG